MEILEHNLFPSSPQKPEKKSTTNQKLPSKARRRMAQISLAEDGERKQQMMVVSYIALGTAGKFLDATGVSLLHN